MNDHTDAQDLAGLISDSGRDVLGFWLDVADTMSEALLIVSPERRVIYGNRHARRFMQGAPEEACGRFCLDVMSCPQCECRCRLFEQGRVDNLDVKIFHPDEAEPHVYRKNARLLRDSDGNVIAGVETFTDITSEVAERAEGERRAQLLMRERKRSDALIGSIVEGVFSLDRKLRIQEFSNHMVEITGWTAEESRGRSLLDLLDIRSAVPAQCTPDQLAERTLDVSIRRKGGSRTPVTIKLTPMRYGADELLGLVRERNTEISDAAAIEREHSFCGIISRSQAMRRVFDVIENTANSEARILVEGESGTGKELVSRALHRLSSRREQPFFAINCATFTGSLLLSELFGHERGAFTGAVRSQPGKLELAREGTLLLDEVGEIPPQHQAVLLRVLEDRQFQRLGGHEHLELRARVIAATNRSLEEALEAGEFRRDLYHRLSVVPIRIPPLRERVEDIELLARYFMSKMAHSQGATPKQLSPEVVAAFEAYSWPGNVRELQNLVHYFGFMADDLVTVEHLPAYMLRGENPEAKTPRERPTVVKRSAVERDQIVSALEECSYRRAKAAEKLGMDRTTLWRKMRRYDIRIE